MSKRPSFNSWTFDEIMFSDELKTYLYSLDVYNFDDLLDNMELVTDRMESDNRVDLVPEFKAHLTRLEDIMEYAKASVEKNPVTPLHMMRGKLLMELDFSEKLLDHLAEFHIYTLGVLIDNHAEWRRISRAIKHETIAEEFVDRLRKITEIWCSRMRTN